VDSQLYKDAIEYEQLTQSIYESILRREGAGDIPVCHNRPFRGRSGVEHQIDVSWKFTLGTVEHTVIIECKNYSTTINLEKVRNFFAVLHDVGNCRGIMVTRKGFQSGAAAFANFYGIDLKLLKEPELDDSIDRIRSLDLQIISKVPVSTPECPIQVFVVLSPLDGEQEKRLNALLAGDQLRSNLSPEFRFCDAGGQEFTEELRWWLPGKLRVLEKEDGGPYEDRIPLDDAYMWINKGTLEEEVARVAGLVVSYYVASEDLTRLKLLAEELVKWILKDYNTGQIDYVVKS
jgi:hypothetical protein